MQSNPSAVTGPFTLRSFPDQPIQTANKEQVQGNLQSGVFSVISCESAKFHDG